MRLREIRLQDFRNYRDQCIELADGINVLLGENGQGKTNALEGMYLLAMGKSHRVPRDTDLIRHGCDVATVTGIVELADRQRQLQLVITRHGKRASLNGIPVAKMSDFIGHVQAVLFSPEDIQLIHGGPAVRRRFLDMEIGQMQPRYLYHLSRYQRVLQQRNTLLKDPHCDPAHLDAFDVQMVEHGSQVIVRRLRFVAHLRELAARVYDVISAGRERLNLKYLTTLPGEIPEDREEQVQAVFADALREKRAADQHLGFTSVGPHRDDLALFLDGQPVQSYASQGQQRTIALSLRLAEIDLIHEESRDYPILLLDDVLSELDDSRQRNLLLSMSQKVQTILTATGLFHLADRLQGSARLFHVDSGIIQVEG